MNLAAVATNPSDLDIFIRAAAVIGPLFGIWVGARINRHSSRDAFFRERLFAEIGQRREAVANFKESCWAYRAEVLLFLQNIERLLSILEEERPKLAYDLKRIREREDKVRASYAKLESFVTVPVQVAAFGAMEAVTKAFNHAADGRAIEARGMLASGAQRHEEFATEFNKEIDGFNAIVYVVFTPVWRAILDRARWEPLPYHAHPDVSAISHRARFARFVDEGGESEHASK